ncbi:DUF420 domain-containing protein [Cryomorpha ignava]|uniref:DUF420 domain-containing protein n=1 Tax=Cryomorpha ignava TaxID=101383 RepID=A0A7K3WTZ1_9FLAO|nr:DUF420 domain-containing protein [Cryomorpha ignava]NEN25157.1 DUF420 domain-containing protein [Cryomorpha ignava]
MKAQRDVEGKTKPWIIAVSLIIPAVVAWLFTIKIEGYDTGFLPPIYATLNGLTALILIAAVIAIKNKRILLHRGLMTAAVISSVLFLVLYIIYHSTSDSTPYGGEGAMRYIYFAILISHIILSIIVVPFVLITYVRGFTGQIAKHKKIARITFPLWLYVAVSGVLVYILISPYYVG